MKKINLVDAFVAIVLIGFLAVGAVFYFRPKPTVQPDIYLTGRVTENAADIADEVQGQIGKTVYFNGTEDGVILVAAKNQNGELYLTVKGPGKIEESRFLFNGISTAVGQKAEIHSNFQAKLIISDVSNVQPK